MNQWTQGYCSKKKTRGRKCGGDVVAQLAKATGRHQTEDAAVPGSNPAPPQSPERGQDI
jgi:hypothetical protein